MTVILKKGFSNLKYHNNSNQYNPREAIDLDNKRMLLLKDYISTIIDAATTIICRL